MNRTHYHPLASLIQAVFPGQKSQISSQNRRLKKNVRSGGLLIKVCLTLETISIKSQSSFPMQDLSVCSCFSAADSEIYVWYVAGYMFDFGLRFRLQITALWRGEVIKSLSHLISDILCFCLLPARYRNCRYILATCSSLGHEPGILPMQPFSRLVCVWFSLTYTHFHLHIHTQAEPHTVGEYVTMPISPWQYYVRLQRGKKASRTTHGRTLRPRVIELSRGAAVVSTRACPDTPERCYGEKCFSALLLHPSGWC